MAAGAISPNWIPGVGVVMVFRSRVHPSLMVCPSEAALDGTDRP